MSANNVLVKRGRAGRNMIPKASSGSNAIKILPVVQEGNKTKTFYDDITSWCRAKSIPVNFADEDCLSYAKSRGWRVLESPRDYNPHSISHTARDLAFLNILEIEGRDLTKLSVLDWFGSPRNLSLTPLFPPNGVTRLFDGNGRYLRSVPSRKGLSVDIVSGPATPILGDAGRAQLSLRRDLLPQEIFDVVIVQDVYQSGGSADTMLTPRVVGELCDRSRSGHVYIMVRFFNGLGGADERVGDRQEQVWYRDEDGMVVSSPEEKATPYPAHPDVNWLQLRHCDGIDSTLIRCIGPYHLVRAARSLRRAQNIGRQELPVGTVVWRELSNDFEASWLPFLWRRMFHKRFSVRVKVHLPTLVALESTFLVRFPNGLTLDSVTVAVTKKALSSMEMVALSERFPVFYGEIIEGTILGVLYASRVARINNLLGLRTSHTRSELDLQGLRAMARPAEARTFSWYNFMFWIMTVILTVVFVDVKSYVKMFPASILPFWWSFVGEELIRVPFPYLSIFLNMLEANYVAYRNDFPSAFGVLLLHFMCFASTELFGWKAVPANLVVHWWWNHNGRVTDAYGQFVDCYREGQIKQASSVWVPLPAGTTLPSLVTSAVDAPRHFRGTLDITVDGIVMTPSEALSALRSVEGRNVLFPILITNRLLWEPANTDCNLLAAVLWRTHNDPFVDCPSTSERHGNWRSLARTVDKMNLFGYGLEDIPSIEQCAILMGKKGPRILNAFNDDVIGNNLNLKKSISLKWNETLSSSKSLGDVVGLKPRAIINLDPIYHARMAPMSRAIADFLHEKLDGSVVDCFGFGVRIYFAAGYDQKQLSDIGRAMQDGHAVIAVSGDDSVFAPGEIFGDGWEHFRFAEADQSMFDHSQDEGPQGIMLKAWMARLGIPGWFYEAVVRCCSAPYRINTRRLRVKGIAGVQMPTGITMTTVLNSLSTLFYYIFALEHRHEYSMVEAGRQLGFNVKFLPKTDVGQLTFLKGWWRLNMCGERVWVPLPSAVIKLGKMLRDPMEVARHRGRDGAWKYRSCATSYAMCAHALANSYSQLDYEYPILGTFLQVLQRLGMGSQGGRFSNLIESWKPILFHESLDRVEAMLAMAERYDLEVSEIVRVEKLLMSINSLPAYVEDQVFDKLCEVDY